MSNGIEAVKQMQRAAVRRISQTGRAVPYPETGRYEATVLSPPFTFAIEDVSVDITLPADGYEDRMSRWAAATAQHPYPGVTRSEQEAVRIAVGRPPLGVKGGKSPVVRARVPLTLKQSVAALAEREHRAESDIVREAGAAYVNMRRVS